MSGLTDIDATLAVLRVTPGWAEVGAGLDDDTVASILGEAEKLARDVLAPLNRRADAEGCRLRDGRVVTPEGYAAAWRRLGADGWLAMDLPEELGGQGLPTTLHTAASAFFEGAAMGLMMLNGSSRAASHMLAQVAPEHAAEWSPRLATGAWAATICISEPDAGSDVGRIRTRATQLPDGAWEVTGTKIWISFGDHDMAERIGHCMLARTGTAEEGTRGLSLFLVPSLRDDGSPNGVAVSRIEEKLGLHGSPTCALSFEAARAILLGETGRGLQHLFAMIERMRLQTACQGLGIAQAASGLAEGYARERAQGGPPDRPAVPIVRHADVRRQLAAMRAGTEVLRALLLEVSVMLDRGEGEAAAILLPLAKNFGAETGFGTSSAAIQVLGGAGYTRDWPAEQMLRDARVIAIYEGTTGMQAQDFLFRRLLRDGGAAMRALLRRIGDEVGACPDAAAAAAAGEVVAGFEALAADLLAGAEGFAPPDLAADGFLRAGWATVAAWMACRLVAAGGELARLGRFRLQTLAPELALARAACRLDAELI
jgi:alkylation response protein AidB-like acyl-CoA dehydrogenase